MPGSSPFSVARAALKSAAGKPGCPTEGLYVTTVKNRMMDIIAKLPVEDKAAAGELLALLENENGHVPAALPAGRYAIVVQEEIRQDAGWRAVCDALAARHPGAEVVCWKSEPAEALPALAAAHPAYTCFVAPCTRVGPDFVAAVHRLTRRYDEDVYTDTRWGILTGHDPGHALELARFGKPITVRRVSAGTEFAIDMVEEGVWYDERVANKTVKKLDGATAATGDRCPTDTTRLLAETLTDWKTDLFITSGHGFPRGWQIGFRYRNGFFESEDGRLFGKDSDGNRFEIRSDHPRLYLAVGNCLIGRIEDRHAFSIAMMKSAGVKGMIGYTVPTWYGYAGWGCLDLFLEQPGRHTLNEAFLANHHALVHRLETAFPGAMNHEPAPGQTVQAKEDPTAAGAALNVARGDHAGLLHDRDVLSYYGDPALEARMKPRPCTYDQSLECCDGHYTLTVTGRRGQQSFAPVNTNGSQRGGRPIVQFLPHRITGVELLEGAGWSPVITDDFILVPNPGKGERLRVRFKAKPAS